MRPSFAPQSSPMYSLMFILSVVSLRVELALDSSLLDELCLIVTSESRAGIAQAITQVIIGF